MISQVEVIIIGAGAAGLYCASHLQGVSFVVLEKNDKVAKKMAISGAGQCNFTHGGSIKDFFACYGETQRSLQQILRKYDNQKTIRFLENLGVKSYIREDGKVFPETLDAQTIIKALTPSQNALQLSCEVVSITYDKEFTVTTKRGVWKSKVVVIATGGKSFSILGSSGDGVEWAKKLGHEVKELSPALTPVWTKEDRLKELSGVSFKQCLVSVKRQNSIVATRCGDLGITHFGVSGPVILNLSRYMKMGDYLEINWIGKRYEEVEQEMLEAFQEHNKQIGNYLKTFNLADRFCTFLLEKLFIEKDKKCSTISKEERKRIIHALTAFPLMIEKIGNYDIAMVTSGGVKLSEIEEKSCESKKVPGLYFIGEVLDVDGDTGGYNIQFAFSSAAIVAESILKKFKK